MVTPTDTQIAPISRLGILLSLSFQYGGPRSLLKLPSLPVTRYSVHHGHLMNKSWHWPFLKGALFLSMRVIDYYWVVHFSKALFTDKRWSFSQFKWRTSVFLLHFTGWHLHILLLHAENPQWTPATCWLSCPQTQASNTQKPWSICQAGWALFIYLFTYLCHYLLAFCFIWYSH